MRLKLAQITLLVCSSLLLSGCFATDVWNSWFPSETDTPPVAVVPEPPPTEVTLPASTDGFVEFQSKLHGIKFSYPTDWGSVKLETPIENVVELQFETSDKGKFVPRLTLVKSAFADEKAQVFTKFIKDATTDCAGLIQENQRIVADYSKKVDTKAEIVDLHEKNSFACKVATVTDQAEFLLSYNPIQIQQTEEETDGIPIPVPVMEYRFVFQEGFGYRSGLASLLVFSATEGTTYADFLGGTLESDRQNVIRDFKLMLGTLTVNEKTINEIDKALGKRRRPTSS